MPMPSADMICGLSSRKRFRHR